MEELFEKIFNRALLKRATDIHLILKKKLVIHFRVLGELCYYDTLDHEDGYKLMNYLKYRSTINTNYRMMPQTGQFVNQRSEKNYYLRVSYLPSPQFESIVIRILNNHDALTIDEITPLNEIRNFLHSLSQISSGLFLISGATGSGKSTTLYTVLDAIIAQKKKNIITIEDPIEMRKEDCLQIELNEKLGITYQQTLRQILRHDPDVIMIGEIRDQQTAQIAMTCALTGHLVLTTIHAGNAYLALKRLENLGISRIDIQDVIIGSLAQKIKYDRIHKKVIILPELMVKQDIIKSSLQKKPQYHSFQYNVDQLIQKYHIDAQVFDGEIYE